MWLLEKMLSNEALVDRMSFLCGFYDGVLDQVHPKDVHQIRDALAMVASNAASSVRLLGNGFWRCMRVVMWMKIKGFRKPVL